MMRNKKPCNYCHYKRQIIGLLPIITKTSDDISVKEILEVVLDEYNYSSFAKLIQSRKRADTIIRNVCMYLIQKFTNLKNTEIAIMFFVSPPNLTMNVKTIKNIMQVDRAFYNEVRNLEEKIKNKVIVKKTISYTKE
jgi:chromosomal replication initiation ATPase DnaA